MLIQGDAGDLTNEDHEFAKSIGAAITDVLYDGDVIRDKVAKEGIDGYLSNCRLFNAAGIRAMHEKGLL